MMRKLFIAIFCFYGYHCIANAVIRGKIINNKGETFFYKPFENFRNIDCETKIDVNRNGQLRVEINIDKPFFIKFTSNDCTFSLFVEPNDSIYFVLRPELKIENNEDWLNIYGNNEECQNIFNKNFNVIPFTKFIKIRDVLEDYKFSDDWNAKFKELNLEIEKQVVWLDSLWKKKKITYNCINYISKDIKAILATEAILISEKLYENLDARQNIINFQEEIFKKYPVDDIELRSGLYAPIYIFCYYRILSKTMKLTEEVICKDAPFVSLMNSEEQEYFWGRVINAVLLFSPEKEFLCQSIENYSKKYLNNTFSTYFHTKEICSKKEQNLIDIKIVEIPEEDFLKFIMRFKGKRILFDLWATWCGPCKLEFKNYTSEFYTFLNNHNVEVAFLSIDNPSNKSKWQEQVKLFNLKGYHGILNGKMIESIKESIFNGNDIYIPRYLLLNENGKFITKNAPSPSDINLMKIIEKL